MVLVGVPRGYEREFERAAKPEGEGQQSAALRFGCQKGQGGPRSEVNRVHLVASSPCFCLPRSCGCACAAMGIKVRAAGGDRAPERAQAHAVPASIARLCSRLPPLTR